MVFSSLHTSILKPWGWERGNLFSPDPQKISVCLVPQFGQKWCKKFLNTIYVSTLFNLIVVNDFYSHEGLWMNNIYMVEIKSLQHHPNLTVAYWLISFFLFSEFWTIFQSIKWRAREFLKGSTFKEKQVGQREPWWRHWRQMSQTQSWRFISYGLEEALAAFHFKAHMDH